MADGRRLTKVKLEGLGSPAELVGARRHGGAAGSKCRCGVQDMEAETKDPPAMMPMKTGTPGIGSATDRGTTSVVETGLADSSGQTEFGADK